MLADDAQTVDHKGFRHARDTPVDGSAARYIGNDTGKGVAEFVEESARLFRRVFVGDAVEGNSGAFGQVLQGWLLDPAGRAPRCPEIDDSDVARSQVGPRESGCGVVQRQRWGDDRRTGSISSSD